MNKFNVGEYAWLKTAVYECICCKGKLEKPEKYYIKSIEGENVELTCASGFTWKTDLNKLMTEIEAAKQARPELCDDCKTTIEPIRAERDRLKRILNKLRDSNACPPSKDANLIDCYCACDVDDHEQDQEATCRGCWDEFMAGCE
jgi:hypothetical protein